MADTAQLKAAEIASWNRELLDEGAELMKRPLLTTRLTQWLANPQAGDPQDILAEFRVMQQHDKCSDVLLVDPDGKVLLSLASSVGVVHAEAEEALALALRDHQPVLTDLHTGEVDPAPHISVVAPLLPDTPGDGQAQKPLGAFILVSNARQFLYTLLESWPTPSETAETLLVQRDGDDVLFLNHLRYRPDAALNLRIPLSQTDSPAVMAVLGKTGVVQGTDYRGTAVLAVLQPIPDSPWFLVAKMDTAEALAEWRLFSGLLLALLLGFVILTGAALLAVWQRSQRVHYQTLYESEAARRASEERYRVVLKSIGDAVIAADAAGCVELLNPVAEALTGWTDQEARGQPLDQVFAIVDEETRQPAESPLA